MNVMNNVHISLKFPFKMVVYQFMVISYLSDNQGHNLGVTHWAHRADPTSAPRGDCPLRPTVGYELDQELKNIFESSTTGQELIPNISTHQLLKI